MQQNHIDNNKMLKYILTFYAAEMFILIGKGSLYHTGVYHQFYNYYTKINPILTATFVTEEFA